MKKKGNFRKVVSGLLAGMTMLSTVLSPMTAYAAEIRPEEKPPLYEEVKDLLDEDEVVTAKDYEMETGSVFEVKSDFTGLEIKDDNKVKVTFEEAKNETQISGCRFCFCLSLPEAWQDFISAERKSENSNPQ